MWCVEGPRYRYGQTRTDLPDRPDRTRRDRAALRGAHRPARAIARARRRCLDPCARGFGLAPGCVRPARCRHEPRDRSPRHIDARRARPSRPGDQVGCRLSVATFAATRPQTMTAVTRTAAGAPIELATNAATTTRATATTTWRRRPSPRTAWRTASAAR